MCNFSFCRVEENLRLKVVWDIWGNIEEEGVEKEGGVGRVEEKRGEEGEKD